MTTSRHLFCATALLLASQPLMAAEGGIGLGQTRVIFSAADKAQSITVTNSDSRAWLIQSRVQMGVNDNSPAPFIVTPPLFTLAKDSRQLLRMLPQGAALPDDRESLFYLAVMAIPAQAEPFVDSARLSVGVRFVVKVFYRPLGLTPSAEGASCLLKFKQDANGVQAENPTPYYQTLGNLTVNNRTISLTPEASLVAPRSSLRLPVKSALRLVQWQTMTDYGGLSAQCQQTGVAPVETK